MEVTEKTEQKARAKQKPVDRQTEKWTHIKNSQTVRRESFPKWPEMALLFFVTNWFRIIH